MLIVDNLLCNKTHQYVLKQEDTYLIGITDFFLEKVGDIIFLELPEVGTRLDKGEVFGTIQNAYSSINLYMPIGGKVLEINENVVGNYDNIKDSSWLLKISSDTANEDAFDLYDYDDYLDCCLG